MADLEQGDYLGTIPFYRQKMLRTRTQRRCNVIVKKNKVKKENKNIKFGGREKYNQSH